MKIQEFRELSSDELQVKERELRDELFNLKFQLSTAQLENTDRLKQVKRDIARILTLLHERELQESEGSN